MKKIMNDPEAYISELMEGLLLAHANILTAVDMEKRVIVKKNMDRLNKVAIISGGGSGHLPLFVGYIGEGMLDGCAIGNVFTSPSADKIYETIKACDQGAGVLCLFGNYSGDKLNFELACEMASLDGIKTQQILVKDDIASAPKQAANQRRGIAGLIYAYKIAGAAAETNLNLEEVSAITNQALENLASMGVALSPCILPEVGKPTFIINNDEIEIGMGIHGEPGIEIRKMMKADEIADILMDSIIKDLSLASNEEVTVMINGLGATPLEELYIVYRRIHERLTNESISIFNTHIGNFATSMEMAGLSLTIMRIDSNLKKLLNMPGVTPFYTSINK